MAVPMMMAAVFLAYVVKGMCGFANTLVFTSVLAFSHNSAELSPLDLLLGFPANLLMVWRERRSVSPRVCLPITAVMLAGCIPGALLLKNLDAGGLKVLCGLVIVFFGAEMLLRILRPRPMKRTPVLDGVIALLSGVLCGLFGVGALMGAYMSRAADDSHSFRANLCFVFACENLFRVILYSVWGLLTPQILKTALILLPFMVLGMLAGMRIGARIRERSARLLISALLMASGTVLFLQSL